MIEVQGLALRPGAFRLQGVSLSVPQGVYAVLMGPTGCGKSTIIEAICGLRPLIAGRVLVGGRDVTDLRPGERGVGYVPQDGALFPTISVRGHLAFALELRNWDRAAIDARVEALAGRLGITHLLDRSPQGLSGGERQRVALGRALAARPAALLLDEPLSALDEDTQEQMWVLLKEICAAEGATVLHITHSRREAAALASLTFQLRDGRLT